MKKTWVWVVVIAVIVFASAGALLWQRQAQKRAAESGAPVIAEIYVEGACVRTIDLSAVTEPETFAVEGAIGTNTVLVEPGRICVTEADCPDHICVSMGWLSKDDAMPIVCLPNKVVIQLKTDSGVDGVTG